MERQVISGFGLFLFPVGHITIPLGKELDILFAHVSKLKRLSSCIRGPDWNGGPKNSATEDAKQAKRGDSVAFGVKPIPTNMIPKTSSE